MENNVTNMIDTTNTTDIGETNMIDSTDTEIESIKFDDIIKGIAEGMIFILQKNRIPKDIIHEKCMYNINGNYALNLNQGENNLVFKDNSHDVNYLINYLFDTDDPDDKDSSKCGIKFCVYHPLFVSPGNSHMNFYASKNNDIKNNIKKIILTIKHYCNESCRNMGTNPIDDYKGISNCEINCKEIIHNVNATELVSIMIENVHDNRSYVSLSSTDHGNIIDKVVAYLKGDKKNISKFIDLHKYNEKTNDDGTVEISNIDDQYTLII
jgi:hypothetical protein